MGFHAMCQSSLRQMQGHTSHPTSAHSLCFWGAGLGVDLTSVALPVHDPLDTAKPDLPPSPVLAVATSDAKLRVRNIPPPSAVRCHTALQSQHSCVTRCGNDLRASQC